MDEFYLVTITRVDCRNGGHEISIEMTKTLKAAYYHGIYMVGYFDEHVKYDSEDDNSENDDSKDDDSENDNSENDDSKDDDSENDNSEDDDSENDNSEDDDSEDDNSENDDSKDDDSENDNSEDDDSEDDDSENDNPSYEFIKELKDCLKHGITNRTVIYNQYGNCEERFKFEVQKISLKSEHDCFFSTSFNC